MSNGDNLDSILADMTAARGWFDHMMGRIEALMNGDVNGGLNAPVTTADPASQNGMEAKLVAFVSARLGDMTDLGVALAVSEQFPDCPGITMAQIGALRQAELWKHGR